MISQLHSQGESFLVHASDRAYSNFPRLGGLGKYQLVEMTPTNKATNRPNTNRCLDGGFEEKHHNCPAFF